MFFSNAPNMDDGKVTIQYDTMHIVVPKDITFCHASDFIIVIYKLHFTIQYTQQHLPIFLTPTVNNKQQERYVTILFFPS